MSQPLRVLIVEDNPADSALVLRELRQAGFEPDWERVDTEAEYLDRLQPDLDVILSDSAMPQFSGQRALALLQERGLDVPFIIVSGTIGEDVAVAAIKQGAADYLLKDRLARLGPAVTLGLDQCRLRREGARAEEAMRQSEHKYRHLFESLSEAALLIDLASGRIVDANRCAEALLGRTRAELLGLRESQLLPVDPEIPDGRRLTRLATTAGRGRCLEDFVLASDGRKVPVQISVTPLDLHGHHLLLALITDLTARQLAEDALRQAKDAAEVASRAKTAFLARMSHEMRTPMHGLIGILDLLIDEETSAERRNLLELEKASALSVVKFLNEILELSSLEAGRVQGQEVVFSLDECIDVHLQPLRRAAADKGVALRYSLAPEIPQTLRGNEGRLGRLIANLVSNAIKFTERGHIEVEVTIESLFPERAVLRFVVRDTGIGIRREDLEMIFRPFSQGGAAARTGSGEGVGLGLAIVQRSVEILGGHLWVESEPGLGSAFCFTVSFGCGMEVL